MNILILGGTGFIGYHTILKLLPQGHNIGTLSLPDINIDDWFPKDVKIHYGDVFSMKSTVLSEIMKNYEALIYAIGPDDRNKAPFPAKPFFQKYLVEHTTRIAEIAKQSGITTFILLNSYFTYFHSIWPEVGLAKHHPYIQARIDQAKNVIATGPPSMTVVTLQLPYIFGVMPHRPPLWKDIFIKMLLHRKTIWFPTGGSNMIAVENVADAIIGAINYGIHGTKYLIGDKNLTWAELFTIMLNHLNLSKPIKSLPRWIARIVGRYLKWNARWHNKEAGLDPTHIFDDIEYREMFFDPKISQKALRYSGGGLEAAIQSTVTASLEYIDQEKEIKKKR